VTPQPVEREGAEKKYSNKNVNQQKKLKRK